jgi:hypothetical protein
MPGKKSTRKRKQNQKVRGNKNNANQNNINIKIGTKSRAKRSGSSAAKPPASSNIVVHVAAPQPQPQHQHIHQNPVIKESPPVAAKPESNSPFVQPPVSNSPFVQPPVQNSPFTQPNNVYHRDHNASNFGPVPMTPPKSKKKRVSLNNNAPSIHEYYSTPPEEPYEHIYIDPAERITEVFDTQNIYEKRTPKAKSPMPDVDQLTAGFHFDFNRNPDIAELESYDATPQPMSQFSTPAEAVTSTLSSRLKRRKPRQLDYGQPEPQPQLEYESVPQLEYHPSPQVENHPEPKPATAEQLISNLEEHLANKGNKDNDVSKEHLNEDEQRLYMSILAGKASMKSLSDRNNRSVFEGLAEKMGVPVSAKDKKEDMYKKLFPKILEAQTKTNNKKNKNKNKHNIKFK